MREILFRGKRIDNGEWVEGSYIVLTFLEEIRHMIFVDSEKEWETRSVDPYTVGQYTGLTDKNGKKIFEGDIVKLLGSDVICPVVFDLTGFYLKYAPPHSHGLHYDLLPLSNYWHAHGAIIKVIGNVTDNPELLEGEK